MNYNEIKIATHWKLSDDHKLDIKTIITGFYAPLRKFDEDTMIRPYLQKNESELQDFFQLVNYYPLLIVLQIINENFL